MSKNIVNHHYYVVITIKDSTTSINPSTHIPSHIKLKILLIFSSSNKFPTEKPSKNAELKPTKSRGNKGLPHTFFGILQDEVNGCRSFLLNYEM